jgi:DNA-binding MarR family transcriptional regulator
MAPDHVDRIVEQWQRERPDLDPGPIRVVGRISRLSRSVDRQLRTVFDRHHLEAWEYDVLASLRRSGPPYELSAGDLLNALMITSGAVTNRIDRLERRGLVRRAKRDEDKRYVLVQLTDAGRTLVDETLPEHLQNERSILEPLSPEEQVQLEGLLRRLQAGLGDGPSRTGTG